MQSPDNSSATSPAGGLLREIFGSHHSGQRGGLDILKFIGPGFLVTVGFIDPGNWASNMAAGSAFGYSLLWVVTLSTVMLIVLQHNAAHLGIATGLCMSEAATRHLPRWVSRPVLLTAVLATLATTMAEVLGGAIALNMLVGLDLRLGSVLVGTASLSLLLTNSYQRVERWIIGFVSLIGISFLIELALVKVSWAPAAAGWVVPTLPGGSMPIVMSVLGAVVMPHNLFLHSEIIQSRHFETKGDDAIRERMDYEFTDTLFSMIVGWAINSAMVILAAATFFQHGILVDDLAQAASVLAPMVGPAASLIFALALLMAGLSSSVTAGMAAGTITAGMSGEPYDIRDRHSSLGVMATFVLAVVAIFFVRDAFEGLVWSQALLSVQLPVTIVLLIWLTSSHRVMGRYANGPSLKLVLWAIAAIVIALNVMLLLNV
ncbi:Nramp family divalent metal transporter [Olsenella massiliensis]|uniref:Nramp family divalent metal transporter n=1 Tax=Olsenella massiliensis TaxID=1622075 RepID=UPI0009EAC055|nr:Nramp family divalent metal transporter [Olsenella massiliensis]